MITARREQVVIRVVPYMWCGMGYSISTDLYYCKKYNISILHWNDNPILERIVDCNL
jgi:hypothetical protein